jgi:3-oxoacid CoA-transferase subunit B
MEHTAGGKPKLLKQCTLPLTGKAVVDLVVTELAVFSIDRAAGRMTLVELAPGVTEAEIRDKTEADYETKLAVAA